MSDLIPFWAWSWLLTSVGITGLFLAGSKKKIGWALGIAVQVLWMAYALATAQLGFVVSALIYAGVYARNWWRWHRETNPGFQVTSFTSYPDPAGHSPQAEAQGTGRVEVGYEFDHDGVRMVVIEVRHPEERWHALDAVTLAQRYRMHD